MIQLGPEGIAGWLQLRPLSAALDALRELSVEPLEVLQALVGDARLNGPRFQLPRAKRVVKRARLVRQRRELAVSKRHERVER